MESDQRLEWAKAKREYLDDLNRIRKEYLEGKILYEEFEDIVRYGQRFENVESLEARLREAEEILSKAESNPELFANGEEFLARVFKHERWWEEAIRIKFLEALNDERFHGILPIDKNLSHARRLPSTQEQLTFLKLSDAAREVFWNESLLPGIQRQHEEQLKEEIAAAIPRNEDMIPLFVVWDDARWDEGSGTLYRRGIYYGAHIGKNVPFRWWKRDSENKGDLVGDATSPEDIREVNQLQQNGFDRATIMSNRGWGSWEKVDSSEVVNAWAELMKRHTDKRTRVKELLKYLNLKTYHDELTTGLERLKDYELDDEKMMSELDKRKEWLSREEYSIEPYYAREMKRCAFKEGKLEIQRLLRKLGYDAEIEIGSDNSPVQPPPQDDTSAAEKAQSVLREIVPELSEVEKQRLAATIYLRERHGQIKVTPNTLHSLPPQLKQELRDFLNVKLGNNPRAKQIIDEVLKKPKKSKRREGLDEYRHSPKDYDEPGY